jgi:cell division protein FtsZ
VSLRPAAEPDHAPVPAPGIEHHAAPAPAPRPAPNSARGGLFAEQARPAASAPQQPEPARPSLFRSVTGAFRRGPSADPSGLEPVLRSEPAVHAEQARAEPILHEPRPEARPSVRPAIGEEVGLEIPAFLRRQSS